MRDSLARFSRHQRLFEGLLIMNCATVRCSEVSLPEKKDVNSSLSPRTPKIYSLDELRRATKNFAVANVIGKGLFGTVYKGKLRNERGLPFLVAIKRYGPDFTKEFHAELSALSRLNHRNIVRCLGSCVQKDEKLLVLEHAHHGSLHDYLQCRKPLLTWAEKLTIALGIAEGLKYLRVVNIIHRDPSSSNILLDKGLVPKIADFSLVLKAFGVKEEEVVHIPWVGTKGYTDPEYILQGNVSTAVDVFIFGVVLMELITGRPPVDPANDCLLVTEMHQKQANGSNLFDLNHLSGVRSPLFTASIKIACELALSCTTCEAKQRPKLSEVLSTLEEALRLQAKDLEGKVLDSEASGTSLV